MIEFIIRNRQDGSELTLPSNPESFKVSSKAGFITVSIDDLGSVPVPGGRDPTTYTWDGVFYGAGHAMLPIIRQWRPPLDIAAQIDNWVDQQYRTKQPLTLVITETNVNKDVWIESWDYEPYGGAGDYKYTLSFTESRDVFVSLDGEEAGSAGGDVAATGEAKPEGGVEAPTPSSYVVQSGDYLTLISQKVYGTTARWKELYEANKDTIGKNPDRIQPGMRLNVPGGKGTEADVEVTTDQLDPAADTHD